MSSTAEEQTAGLRDKNDSHNLAKVRTRHTGRKFDHGEPIRKRVRPGKGTMISLQLEDFRDWDLEELQQGRRRDKNGKFSGRPPKVIPRECLQELQRRLFEDGKHRLVEALGDALDVAIEIMHHTDTDDATRLRAATYIIDRVMGKATDKVSVVLETREAAPWEQARASAIVSSPAEDDIVDAEVVDDGSTE